MKTTVTNKLSSPASKESCPYCHHNGTPLWSKRRACVNCSQPQVVAPSGGYALCRKTVGMGGGDAVAVYSMAGGGVEVDVLDEVEACKLSSAITGALLAVQLARIVPGPRKP